MAANLYGFGRRPGVPEPLTSYRMSRYQLPQDQNQWAFRRAQDAYRNPNGQRRFREPDPDPQYLLHEDIAGRAGTRPRPPPPPRGFNSGGFSDVSTKIYKNIGYDIGFALVWIISSAWFATAFGWFKILVGLGLMFWMRWVSRHCWKAVCVMPIVKEDNEVPPLVHPCDICGEPHEGLLCAPRPR